MTLPVPFAPGARADLEAAVDWYERRREGLGLEFLEAVTAATQAIARWPKTGSLIPNVRRKRTARRYPVRRFPYHVVWVMADEKVYVIAVAHDRRLPGYWAERLG